MRGECLQTTRPAQIALNIDKAVCTQFIQTDLCILKLPARDDFAGSEMTSSTSSCPSTEASCMSKIRAAIDDALQSRLKLQEAKIEVMARTCQGLETNDWEKTLQEACVESERAIRELNHRLLSTECC